MKRASNIALAALSVAAVLLGCVGRADASEPPIAAPRGKAEWKPSFQRFSTYEGAATLGLTVGAFVLDHKLGMPDHALLPGAVPILDDGMRGLLRGRSAEVQAVSERLSDMGYRTMALFPYVIDVGVVALGVHRDPDLAAQLALIDAQALTLSGVTQMLASRLLGRARPYEHDCQEPGQQLTWRTCREKTDYRSFYSGHAAAAFTGAGLVCAHHQNIPLYGGGAPDAWACVWAVSVASATGLLRITADAHWTSDVLVGSAIGWFYGYVMPRFMHYDTKATRRARERNALVWTPTFSPAQDGGVVGVTGAF